MRTKQLVLTALFAALTAIGAFLKIQIPVEGIPAITLQFLSLIHIYLGGQSRPPLQGAAENWAR